MTEVWSACGSWHSCKSKGRPVRRCWPAGPRPG